MALSGSLGLHNKDPLYWPISYLRICNSKMLFIWEKCEIVFWNTLFHVPKAALCFGHILWVCHVNGVADPQNMKPNNAIKTALVSTGHPSATSNSVALVPPNTLWLTDFQITAMRFWTRLFQGEWFYNNQHSCEFGVRFSLMDVIYNMNLKIKKQGF